MTGGWLKSLIVLVTVGQLWASAVSARMPVLPSDGEAQLISVVVDPGITRTRQLPTSELRRLRKAMVAGVAMTPAQLRRLALRRDGLAAMRYARLLQKDGLGHNASDIAFFASIAAGAGRIYVLDEMIEALHLLDPATEPKDRIRQYIRVLYAHAYAGNVLALDAMIWLNGEGQLFGQMSDQTRGRLLETGKSGDGRIELGMAMRDLSDPEIGPKDLRRAIGYLELAEQRGEIAITTMAQGLRKSAEMRLKGMSVN